MLGMGWEEVLVVLVVAVIVIGPKHLPDVARTLGKAMAYFRKASGDLREAINSEVNQYDEMKDLREIKDSLNSELYSIKSTTRDYIEHEVEKEGKVLAGLEDEINESTASGEESAPASAATDFPTPDDLVLDPMTNQQVPRSTLAAEGFLPDEPSPPETNPAAETSHLEADPATDANDETKIASEGGEHSAEEEKASVS